ncbi:hypothetical protein M0R04_08755 [Candidatus Dojkabacteria bacterium]|jgi:hypothetical protein|nr:hypothetical protein [Candidatus Dojkabacteria bacterium]
MENRWAYLGMDMCFIMSAYIIITATAVCNKFPLSYDTGLVYGATSVVSKILFAVGFVFLYIVIKNNIKKSKEEKEGNKNGRKNR